MSVKTNAVGKMCKKAMFSHTSCYTGKWKALQFCSRENPIVNDRAVVQKYRKDLKSVWLQDAVKPDLGAIADVN